MNDDWLTQAFLDASAKRVEASTRDARQILLQFLEVLDSLDRMLAVNQRAAARPDALDQLEAIRKQMVLIFTQAGVTFFESIGQPFDPARHHAVDVVKGHTSDDAIVVEEIARGCSWRGALLREARVVIAHSGDERERSVG